MQNNAFYTLQAPGQQYLHSGHPHTIVHDTSHAGANPGSNFRGAEDVLNKKKKYLLSGDKSLFSLAYYKHKENWVVAAAPIACMLDSPLIPCAITKAGKYKQLNEPEL